MKEIIVLGQLERDRPTHRQTHTQTDIGSYRDASSYSWSHLKTSSHLNALSAKDDDDNSDVLKMIKIYTILSLSNYLNQKR